MPVRPDVTVDECLRVIRDVSQAMRKAREVGINAGGERTREDDLVEMTMSNAGVFMLLALGMRHDEIVPFLKGES